MALEGRPRGERLRLRPWREIGRASEPIAARAGARSVSLHPYLTLTADDCAVHSSSLRLLLLLAFAKALRDRGSSWDQRGLIREPLREIGVILLHDVEHGFLGKPSMVLGKKSVQVSELFVVHGPSRLSRNTATIIPPTCSIPCASFTCHAALRAFGLSGAKSDGHRGRGALVGGAPPASLTIC